jgi:hypothetical protein
VGFALLRSAAPLARDANNHTSHRRVDPPASCTPFFFLPLKFGRAFRFPPPPLRTNSSFERTRVRFGRCVRISRPSRCIRSVFDPGRLGWLPVLIWRGNRGGRKGFLINFDRPPRRRFPRSLGRIFSFLATLPHG